MEPQIILTLLVLGAAIVLFTTELLRADLIAILIALSLAWLGLISPLQAFSGFASNAVVAMISVMILGYGINRTGAMISVARRIVAAAGRREERLIATISLVVGILSGFIQNIGSTALFLPAVTRISRQTGIPATRLIMPMGFAAILGGTLTMIGTGPLIIVNDLIRQGGLEPFGLFASTPIGIALLSTGIAYFFLFGRRVLPAREEEAEGPQEALVETWQLPSQIRYYRIPRSSPLVGRTREEIRFPARYRIYLLAVSEGEEIFFAPWRYTRFVAGQELALLGKDEDVKEFARGFGLLPAGEGGRIQDALSRERAGFAEAIIPPRAPVAGKAIREIALRKNYGVEPLVLISGGREQREAFGDHLLQAGDALIVHGPWDKIRALGEDENFLLATPVEGMELRESRAVTAVLCFIGAVALTFTGLPISLSLLTGVIAMVALRVITIDEAYRAVDWRTIVLIGGLIPLGIAMDTTGTAEFVATALLQVLLDRHVLILLLAVGLLTTVFSLFMSNVAATVVLVPLALVVAQGAGIDPGALALLVAICAANSFVLPTHQVNAFLMVPGGYRTRDYMKAGGIMTVLFLIVAVGLVYLVYV
ncbi:MAG: SLC13 family permease [Methanomicrobiaceae archaeon]|nr:SLC13 family permease [Methanomicrobiaceae archaeon]MDD5419701.1 SLC13 family permease [Methanomicrobiaceae archaeon]